MQVDLFSKYQFPVKSRATERGEILKSILEKVNKEREGTKYKPLTLKGLAVKLSHLDVSSLCYLTSICKDYENRGDSYSKCMWGSIKVK